MRLPNFLVVGAAKAGTTSLHHYLGQHPDVYVSFLKEPNFFATHHGTSKARRPRCDRTYNHGSIFTIEDYVKLFAKARDEKAVGEASTSYLYFYETVPEQILRYLGPAKIVVVLRHPVERAYSAYMHLRRDEVEPCKTFEEGLAAEESRVAANYSPRWYYRRRSVYAPAVKRYIECFGRENVGVFLYDDLVADATAFTRGVYRFLGVDDSFTPNVSVHLNSAGAPRSRALHTILRPPDAIRQALSPLVPTKILGAVSSMQRRNLVKPPILEATRAEFAEYVRADVEEVSDLLGRDLSHWLA